MHQRFYYSDNQLELKLILLQIKTWEYYKCNAVLCYTCVIKDVYNQFSVIELALTLITQ
jgi:hypothetical protein